MCPSASTRTAATTTRKSWKASRTAGISWPARTGTSTRSAGSAAAAGCSADFRLRSALATMSGRAGLAAPLRPSLLPCSAGRTTMPDNSPVNDQIAAYLTGVRALNKLWSYATKDDIYRLLAAVERVLALAAKWDREAADGIPLLDREIGALVLRRAISAELLGKEPRPILCAHADQGGAGAHMLAPGETCPLAEPRRSEE